jgi:sulfite reductase alpha subunit-like flavoprotein
MGREVRETLTSVAQSAGGLSSQQATEYVQALQKKARYIQELWS